MKLGIKVNTDLESFKRLEGANPPFAEVWFNINDKDRYRDLFAELTRRRMDVGLHFWGILEGQILPNLAYPDPKLIKQSMLLMRQTIDVAAQNHFSYVNIHPGSAALLTVDFKKERFDIVKDPVEMDTAIQTFLEHAQELHGYAKTRGVVFTVETVPSRATNGWYDAKARLVPKNIYELPVSAILLAAENGLWIANDFCHTAANVITDDPNIVWTYVAGITKVLAPRTRLIHLGFVMPPYNGTDNHDELDNPLLRTDRAVPNHEQMIELLKGFQDRSDVWILVEPKSDHIKNYLLAKKLLAKAEKP